MVRARAAGNIVSVPVEHVVVADDVGCERWNNVQLAVLDIGIVRRVSRYFEFAVSGKMSVSTKQRP